MLNLKTEEKLSVSSAQVQSILKQSNSFHLVPVGYVFLNAPDMCETEPTTDSLKQQVLRLINNAIRCAETVEAAKELNELRTNILCYFTSGFRKEIDYGTD